MPFAGDNAADEFVFVTSKIVATRATGVCSSSSSANSSPQAGRRRLHLQPIPTHIDAQQPSPTDHRQRAFASSTSSVSKATPLPPELIELLPQNLRENAVKKFSRNPHRLPERPPEFISEKGGPPARPPLPANYFSGDYSNILDKQESATGPDPDHNYDYLSDLVTSDALSVLGRSHAHSTRASSVTPASLPSASKTSHTPHHTAPAALGISSDSGISSGSSCSSSNSSSVSSRSSSSKSLPRVGSKTSVNGKPLEPPASPKFCRGVTGDTGISGGTSSSSSGCDPPLTQMSITAVLASDGERASMFRRLETSTPTQSPLLDSFRAGSIHPSPHGSPKPAHKHVAIATITTMGQTHPTHTQHTTTTTQPQQAKKSASQPIMAQQPVSNTSPSSKDNHSQQSYRTPSTSSNAKPTKSILKDECKSVKMAAQPLLSRAQQPLPTQLQQVPQTSTGSISRNISHNRSAPSSPEMRRAWNQVGIPTHVSHNQGSSCVTRGLSGTKGSSASPVASRLVGSRSPSPHTDDAIYDNIVISKPEAWPGTTAGPLSGSSRPTASVPPTITPIMTHTHCMGHSKSKATPSSKTPPPRRILTPAPPAMATKPPSPPTQRRNARSTTPTGSVACPPGPMGTVLHYYTPGDPNYPGYWAPVWGSSPQLYSAGQAAPCYTTYVCGHGGPGGAHPAYPVPIVCDGRSHSCERLPPGVSAPNSPRTGRRSASPWRGGSASPVMARHSPSPEPGGAGRPPRPRRPPGMRKSKTVEVAYLDLHPISNSAPTATGYCNQTPVLPGVSPSHAATSSPFITHYPYAHPSSFNIHASPYVPPQQQQQQQQSRHHQQGFLQQKDRPSSPTPSVSSAISLDSKHKSVLPGQAFMTKEKVTYKRFYKCMKSLLKPTQ